MSPEEREEAKQFAPYQIFTVTKEGSGSSQCTSFTVMLNGSKSRLERSEPISFSITFEPPVLRPLTSPKQYPIKLIRGMYAGDSEVLEGIIGDKNPSLVLIKMDDVDCCILLCEISFHLFLWKDLGEHLGLNEYVEFLRGQYGNLKYVPAFEMLKEWVKSCPNLGTLIEGLKTVNFFLDLSSWTTSYHTVRPKTLDANFMHQLAMIVQYQWKFIARILGKSEGFIDTMVSDYPNNSYEQAYQMLHQWKRQSPLQEREAYLRLFDSIHLVFEHNQVPSLKAALALLE